MSVTNDNSNFKPVVGASVSASAEVSTGASATTSPPAIVDTSAKDDTTALVQSPNPSQPFVPPSKKPRIALPGKTLTQTGLAIDALNGEKKVGDKGEAKAEATSGGNLFFNVSHDQVLLQMALQEFVKMNQDVRKANTVLSLEDRKQQIEARNEMEANVKERGQTLADQYSAQGWLEIAGGWVNLTTGVVGLGLSKAAATRKVNNANAAVPGGLSADTQAEMLSRYESSFSAVSQQLGSAISGTFSGMDKFIQSDASIAVALLDAQKTLLEDRQQAIKAAKDLAEQASGGCSSALDEFRRGTEKSQESMQIKM